MHCLKHSSLSVALLLAIAAPLLKAESDNGDLIAAMKFVHVPKGAFWMSKDGQNAQVEATIASDFELAAYLVTQAQWQKVNGENPSAFSRQGAEKNLVKDVSAADLLQFPVENVSWTEVQWFLEKLNEREKGKGWIYRLPTEAEWEYACRNACSAKAECSFDFYLDEPTNDLSSTQANYNGNYPAGKAAKGPNLGRTSKVGLYPPNKLGLYDMHGNVLQWCANTFKDGDNGFRALRGSGWFTEGPFCKTAHRNWGQPTRGTRGIGFRLARDSVLKADQVRRTVSKSLSALETKGLEWETTKCVSCHHGPWMMWTGYEAKKLGFTVNDKSLETVRLKALQAYNNHPKLKPTSRDNLTEMTINVFYVMFGAAAKGSPDAETTKFMDRAAAHLIEHQKDDGSWKVIVTLKSKDGTTNTFLQPPLIDDQDVTTLWSLLVLTYRKPAGVAEEAWEQSKTRGFRYLSEQAPGETLQSLTLRIMLHQQIGKADAVPPLVQELLSKQREDGGWSQTQNLKSDALGTGQALVALSAARFPNDHPAVEKARRYLLRTQSEDGTWFVLSRAYQAPEFSSYVGAAWATLGLMRTLPAR